MNDWRPGMSKALITPWNALSANTSPMVMRCASVSSRQRERLDHRQSLRPYQYFVAIDAIHDDAGEGRQQKRRNLPGKADGAQQQR